MHHNFDGREGGSDLVAFCCRKGVVESCSGKAWRLLVAGRGLVAVCCQKGWVAFCCRKGFVTDCRKGLVALLPEELGGSLWPEGRGGSLMPEGLSGILLLEGSAKTGRHVKRNYVFASASVFSIQPELRFEILF